MAVTAWTAQQLTGLGVDSVFAPYVLGMLQLDGADEDEEEEKRAEVLELLMGWLDASQQGAAENFVDELLLYVKDPHQLALLDEQASADCEDASTTSPPLNAAASAYVPWAGEPALSLEPEFEDASLVPPSDEPEIDMDDEDAFYWSIAYELVEQLLSIYPAMDPERLLDLLKAVELDVHRARVVMQAIVESEAQKQNAQVCRHYLQGECRRADCWFLHDTHLITCRYWIRGGCLQGEECAFAHSFDVAIAEHGACQEQPEESDDDDDWVGDQLEATNFPSLTKTPVAPTSDAALSLDFARALSMKPDAVFPAASFTSGRSASHTPAYSRSLSAPVTARWVDTGYEVSSQYKQSREQARHLALARNQCFMNATHAYRQGNKSLAKELSRQGQQYNAQMKDAHYAAASVIFEARNPNWQRDGFLDLHGLHVAEALELLAQLLPTATTDTVCVVTGSGHHSHHVRLKPAVERFLAAEGYSFAQIPDRKGYVGMLQIDFMLLVSRQGKTRLSKWYSAVPLKDKARIIRDVTALVLGRPQKQCNFIEWKDQKIVYKRYASLYFVACISKEENELITLEIIHLFVEVLDRYFGNVCELDIIFNFHKAYYILDELLIGGNLQEPSKKEILRVCNQQEDFMEETKEEMFVRPRNTTR
ncbi:hypothetical protein ACHHYP_02591 [Achlya hypogyna]|uniref:Uncharacterized protein n=1 Tax=Achlya hypogyna TaxID=1202772 RepID=A0A1V9ZS76_ACHHY|nr:hypothetical protein ACHHYP_02591 [Achlya hypogyna]